MYHLEGKELVIDGWEKGISDNPYEGVNDMRCLNIVSVPGEVAVSFSPTLNSLVSANCNVVSADAGTDVVTVSFISGVELQSYQAVTFAGGSLPGNIVAGTVYWIEKTGTFTLKVYTDRNLISLLNISSTGTGTMTTINMTAIKYFDPITGVALDDSGRAWSNQGVSIYRFLGNTINSSGPLSETNGNGLIWWKNYLFVFYDSSICYLPWTLGVIPTGTWVNEWNPATGAPGVGVPVFNTGYGISNPHSAIIAVNDGGMYITDANYVASLLERSGQTFDPTNTATYDFDNQATTLPKGDIMNCITELGDNLLIGGSYNAIYTWNRVDTNRGLALLISDVGVYFMITINTNAYIFAGKRGRIYVTNGSQAQLFAKIPDHISGGIEPIISWGNCSYNRNQLYFGVSATNNAGTLITSYSGLWAIDMTSSALRAVQLSSESTASISAVWSTNVSSVPGLGVYSAWKTASSYGIDSSDSDPYNTYVPFIDTDFIPVGQFLNKTTFTNLEFKLAMPLVTGEGIKISVRPYRTGAFSLIGETTTAGSISDAYLVNFDQYQWVQFRIEFKSTENTPSFVRLRELRIR